jgi:hypothetical protein
MAFFLGQIKVYQLLPYGLEPYIYTKENLYIIALIPVFHNVSARVFSLYDPTIGFGLDIVTSDIIGIVIAVLITILFFVVMRKTRSYPQKNNE